MIRAGILGATGYMGGEVLRILLDHPDIEIAWATSRTPAPVETFHPNLYGTGIQFIHPDDITACDVVFAALPTSATLEWAPKVLSLADKFIDLGATFRLNNRQQWELLYQQKHSQWSLATQAVYGISELHYDELKTANIIANPGCFSSSAILALAPLLDEKFGNNFVDINNLIITGLSGTAGVGAELSRAAHHPEIGNNVVPYNVVDHRHSYEMEQELSIIAKQKVRVHFTPTYVPITRGILNICNAFPIQSVRNQDLIELYTAYYADHPFVNIYTQEKDRTEPWQYRPYPWVSAVAGTNNCLIGFDVDEKRNRIVIFSVLDSLGKGGAHVAVENMNIMYSLDRTSGLSKFGRHPC